MACCNYMSYTAACLVTKSFRMAHEQYQVDTINHNIPPYATSYRDHFSQPYRTGGKTIYKVSGELENMVHYKKPLPETIFLLVFLTILPLLVADVPMHLNCEPFSNNFLTLVIMI